MGRVFWGVFCAAFAMGQGGDPATWKEFSIAPAGKLDKPLEKTVEWTFEEAGSRVAYPACCPWLDVEGGFRRIANDPWSLQANGVSIKSVLSRLEGLPQVQIVAPEWMTRDRYSVTAQVSDAYRLQLRRRDKAVNGPRAELWALMQKELLERLQLKMHREEREASVYVLRPAEGAVPKLGQGGAYHAGETPISLHVWARDGAFETSNGNDFILLTWLQNVLKRPVLGKGLPAGPYQFFLKWMPGDDQSLVQALHDRLGLDLVEEKRRLPFLVVEYALKPEWR
jgi:uncharacterized protein (TIGR03435 family)